MAVVATLDVILAAKTQQFNKDMQKEVGSIKGLKTQFQSAGSFDLGDIGGSLRNLPAIAGPAGLALVGAFAGATVAVGGTLAAIKAIHAEMDRIDQVSDAASKLGYSFSELETVRQSFAETSGLGFEAVDAALQKFNLGLAEAARTGQGDVFDSLSAAGLNAGDLIKMGPVEALKEVSRATAEMKNPADQMAIAFELFGKQGVSLVSSLREGPEALSEMERFAKETGLALSQAQAEQVGAANDAFGRMQNVAVGAWRQISAEAAPVLQVIYEGVTEIGMSFGGWQTVLPEIVDTGAQFAGIMYDIGELAVYTYTTLGKIKSLDFTGLGEGLKEALDFSSGDRFQANIQAARDKAKQEANDKEKVFKGRGEESAIAEYEARKQLAKEQADAAMKAANDQAAYERKLYEETMAARKKDQEDLQRAADNINRKFDPGIQLRESLVELNRMLDAGLISKKIFDKASMDAAASATPEYKGAVSAQQGSVEAYKLIIERDNKDNQLKLQMKNLAEKQLEALKQIAAGQGTLKAAR